MIVACLAIMINHIRPDIPEVLADELVAKLVFSIKQGVEMTYETIHQLSAIMEEMARSTLDEGEERH